MTRPTAFRPLSRPIAIATTLLLSLPLMPEVLAAPPTRGSTARPAAPTSRGSTARPTTRGGTATRGAAPPTGGELSGDETGVGAYNTCKKQPKGARFRITLPEEAELKDLVNWMSSISCQKFILDLKARSGKVTILSPEPVTIEEAYAAFYASLQTMGLTVEPSGKYFKIVETTDANSRTLPVYTPGSNAPANDRYVTKLYRTKSEDNGDVVNVINKLKTKHGSVEVVGDLLIITDTGASIKRLSQIIRQIDKSTLGKTDKVFFYQLQHADPEEVASIIREVFAEKEAAAKSSARPSTTSTKKPTSTKSRSKAKDVGPEAEFSRVIVDERTGTLIIVTSEADYNVIKRLIEQLDVPLVGGGTGRIHVVKLKNADPEEVASVLNQLGQGGGASNRGGRNNNNNANNNAPQGPASAELFSGELKVTADPATRSLVILASQSDYRAVRKVIEALDAERKQVYIEVYLLELSIGHDIEGGTAGHFGAPFDVNTPGTTGQGLGFVGSAPDPNTNSLVLSPTILNGIAAGALGPEVPGSGQFLGLGRDIPAFGVVIQAVQSDTDVNLVAEPHLYTADNQEASIEVGRNVPTPGNLSFPGGGQGGGLVPVQGVQRQDVTLKVQITPHVNDEKTVTLDIEMENNDIESIHPTLGVTTTKRRLKLDKVVARDDQPIVLGGLVSEVERDAVSQVPGLGSIPLLGWLFKRKSREKDKVNLLMVLVPHILETPDDARRIHERRMKERLEFLERETAFKRRDLSTNVNYRKKLGLLSQVNREFDRMVVEDEFLRQTELEFQQERIAGEIGLAPVSSAELDEDDSGPSVGSGDSAVPAPPISPDN